MNATSRTSENPTTDGAGAAYLIQVTDRSDTGYLNYQVLLNYREQFAATMDRNNASIFRTRSSAEKMLAKARNRFQAAEIIDF